MNRAHPLPLPRAGDFLFIARLPGVTLRSPPAMFLTPLQGFYTLTRALITGGNAALTPGCNLVALTGLALRTFPGSAKRKSVILGERNAKHNAPCVRGERICKICVLAENSEAPSWQSCGAAAYRLRRIPTFPHFFTLKSPK